MKTKKNSFENLTKDIELFQKSSDEKVHKEAIGEILKQISSKRRFNQALKLENVELSSILAIFEKIPRKSCKSKEECDSLREIGQKARELTAAKKYKEVVALGFNLAADNIFGYLESIGEECRNVSTEEFYKEYLPNVIFTQFVLLEMMATKSKYKWDRGDKIVRQSLVLAGMCFLDIYAFVHEMGKIMGCEGDDDELDDEFGRMLQKDELYYDAMEWLNCGEHTKALKCMKKALKIDSDYIQTYVGLVAVYREIDDFENEKKYADLGFELTKKKFSKWPAKMEWGIMENRAYMRSICDKATTSQISGDEKTAEELYRLLLKMNPNDNQGVRYLLAGMYEGLSPDDVDRMTDEGNEKQDWSSQENTVVRQNKIHKFWKKPRF